MTIFQELKYGSVGRASGLDVQSCDFLQYCNDSVEMLMNRGNFFATVQPLHACVRGDKVTWPRHVGTLLAVNNCSFPATIANHWYQFMPLDSQHVRDVCALSNGGFLNSGRIYGLPTESVGTSPVFNPIEAEGFKLRTYITQLSDIGKTITYYGIDTNGQTIRTARTDGTIQDGVQIFLNKPYVDTPMAIRHVTRAVKDVTDGALNVYQFNVAGGFLLDLAQYQPSETNPEYVVSKVHGVHGCAANCQRQISALVKQKFVPFKFDDDLVQIDCQAAIRDMFLSLRKKEAGDLQASAVYEASAYRELNLQMQDKFPIEQFQVSFRPYGRANLQKVTNGFI